MQSVQAEMWDPHPPSKHASLLPQPPHSNSRLAHVTTAAPAKRITFYKSGDSQFGGIRMAVHKRSFKCFDALLDDLTQKMPLPFGVRTVTTPRGTHAIKHLEQLQDGGCYLCSDRRQAKPVNMELLGKRPNIWYHHSQRPHRPDTSSTTPPSHLPYRQRRILLVKNSEPGMRRSVVLSRRSARSLKAFLDEVSEVMQFHVRKLYTAEGRRIDSVQSLMTCPGVLVCVGREAFSPMLVNFIRKSSEDKLPGLGTRSPGLGPRTPGNGARSPATQGARSPPHGAQSRASEYSEGHESKKNVNFGLETKKSIIHPRSDSSNRSTHFSMSSEKSYGNGVSAYSQAKPSIMNEDIEKRVVVNKDGSLSVEMRVRFRLHNDETLQWSTHIKKSPSLTNDCCPLSQAPPHYLQQGQSESCSDPDSTSFDPESVDYSSQPLRRVSDGNHCPCCYQRQEQQYDLWENPAHSHKQPPVPPPHPSSHTHTMMRHTHSSSSSSSCNSRRVVRCRARLSNSGGHPGSEHSQLVQEEMCVTEQVERRVEVEQDGDTRVEVCKVSRCCSRSEVVAVDSNLQPLNGKSVEDELMTEEGGERPLSAISSSSHILQSLKEDQDDDLPPSASQCSNKNEPSLTAETQPNDKPTSNVSADSAHSTEHNKNDEERGSRAASAASSCHCGAATPHSTAEVEEMDRAPSSKSKISRASCRSSKANKPTSEEEGAADDEDEELKRVVSGLSGHTGLSAGSQLSSVCPNCGGCKRGVNSSSRASQRSHHSHQASPKPENASDDDGSDGSAVSTQSNKSNLTNHGRFSAVSNVLEGRASPAMSTRSDAEATGREEERAASATSHRSNRSHKSGCDGSTGVAAEKEEERSPSVMSAQSVREEVEGEIPGERPLSSSSAKSGASSKMPVKLCIMVASPPDNTAVEEDDANKRTPSALSGKTNGSDRPDSALSAKSAKSNVSAKSGKSHRSTCSHCAKTVSLGAKEAKEGTEAEERAASAISGKSNLSAKSHKSPKSTKASERSLSPRSEPGGDLEKRTASQMSGKSVKSSKSSKSNKNGNETAASPGLNEGEEKENAKSGHTNCDPGSRVASPARTPSAMSGKSNTSAKSCKSNQTTASPNPLVADGPPTETNGEEKESQERGASAMSVKSKSSVRSDKNPNVVTINPPEEEGNDTTERSPSATSAKSAKSISSALFSPKPPATPPSSPQSPVQQLAPGPSAGDTRGPSALSVRSIKSAKSGRSRCHCGAATAKKNKEEVEDNEEVKSEAAASILSSSTKRRESGGTEQPLSRNSSGSVSLGLPEDQEAADSDSGKSNVSFHANTEKVKTPDVPKSTEPATREDVEETKSQKSNNNGSKSTLSHNPPAVDIPIIETPGESEDKGEEGGEQETVRASSAFSAKSSRSHKSCCKCSVKAAAQMLEAGSEKSASTTKGGKNDNRTSSAMSSASAKAKNVNVAKTAGDSANNDTDSRLASKAKGEEDIADNKAASKSRCCLRPVSAASPQSDSLNPVKGCKANSSGSVKTSSSQKKETAIKSASPRPVHSSRPRSKGETCSEGTLSHSLSAADLLKETTAAVCPHSHQSKASKTSDKQSRRSRNQTDQEELDLTPACLPNASPIEVVSDWLRSIPTNSSMLTLGDEEEKTGGEAVKEESPDDENVDEKAEAEEEEEVKEEGDAVEEVKSSAPAPAVGTRPNTLLLSSESPPRNWHSSAAVMKVLLGSSLGRCQSMPEVSPVYGRRLSTSARGFLDCLAQLQLIEPALSPGCDQNKDHQYEDVMAILQSLWLTEPRDIVGRDAKDGGTEQVTPPRSSSGVGMSSGSGGSGKENGNQGGDETEPNQTNEAESLHEDEGAEKVTEEEEEEEGKEGHQEIEVEPEETEKAKTDIAEELVQSEEVSPSLDSPKVTENPSSSDKSSANDSSKSPTDNERDTLEDYSSGTPPTVLRATLSKKLSQDPDPVWVLHLLKKLEKQFMNHYSTAMAEFKVRWELDDSVILDTMISELRDEVSRRIQSSIEREMRKIQSRAGRAGRSPQPPKGANLSRESTMTEKRRRMLRVMKNQSVKTADSLSDGEMTGDFSDQRSEDDYCPCDACVRKKMAARPLKTNPLAAEAPVMMEFDLLKILQLKKSPSPSAVPPPVEEEGDSMVADEEGRNLEVVQEEEEEDETKEDIKADVVLEETIPEEDEEKEDGGEAGEGEEEEEEEKEGETSGEEDGGEETSDNVEEEEEEAQCQCQCAKNEEEESEKEEEETAEGEEETSDNTGEDEERAGEEEEGEDAEDEGETEGNEGETGTGEEEEESNGETVKEATRGEGETAGNAKGEEEEEEEEVEECEVCEFKPEEEEEEQTSGRESGEEASGETEDDNAAKNAAIEESTLVEEFTEGNASASAEAEDEDDGDDGTGEEESHDDSKGGEGEEQEKEASEEERASPQGLGVTEGEEADAEDSTDTDGKRPTDTSVDGSGRDATGDEEEVVEDAVEEIKPEEEEGEVNRNKKEDVALLHQITRTSVESQPGSLEDIDTNPKPVNSIEVPKMAAAVSGGGAGQRRSRSPARVKRRKPKECDVELDF